MVNDFGEYPLVGTQDGTNTTFTITATNILAAEIYRNGILQGVGDCTRTDETIVFLLPPAADDWLTSWVLTR